MIYKLNSKAEDILYQAIMRSLEEVGMQDKVVQNEENEGEGEEEEA